MRDLIAATSPRCSTSLPGVTAPLLELLRQDRIHSGIAVRMNTEISWLFAFLTAKEDSTVSALMAQGLVEVSVRAAGLCGVSLRCSVYGGKVFLKKLGTLTILCGFAPNTNTLNLQIVESCASLITESRSPCLPNLIAVLVP